MTTKWTHKYTITKFHLKKPSKRRSGILMPNVLGIVAHDTGNAGSTAWQNVRYYDRTCNEMSASAHLFIDDKDIIECIPALSAPPEKAWHVLYDKPKDNEIFGDDANDVCVGVEWCYGGQINLAESYKKYIYTIAYICDRFNIDPLTKISAHYILDPERKTDPKTPLKLMNKTLDDLKRDVLNELKACRQ